LELKAKGKRQRKKIKEYVKVEDDDHIQTLNLLPFAFNLFPQECPILKSPVVIQL